jgi:hypothetical protein
MIKSGRMRHVTLRARFSCIEVIWCKRPRDRPAFKTDAKNGNKLGECELISTFSGEGPVAETGESGDMPWDPVKENDKFHICPKTILGSWGHCSVGRISHLVKCLSTSIFQFSGRSLRHEMCMAGICTFFSMFVLVCVVRRLATGLVARPRSPTNWPWRPIRFWDVEARTCYGQSVRRWQWSYHPEAPVLKDPRYSFLLGAESTPWP